MFCQVYTLLFIDYPGNLLYPKIPLNHPVYDPRPAFVEKDPVIPSEPNQASTDHPATLPRFKRMRTWEWFRERVTRKNTPNAVIPVRMLYQVWC